MGSVFVARTYTPIEWDRAAGRTRILGFSHGGGPGCAWIDGVEPGDECDVTGSRSSLDVSYISGPLAVFGDETSIGLAHALTRQDRTRTVACRFEVSDVDSSKEVLAQLGLHNAKVFAKTPDDAHFGEMADTLLRSLPRAFPLC